MSSSKKYWKGLEELDNIDSFKADSEKEFPEHLPTNEFLSKSEVLEDSKVSRRDFLKFLGFSTVAASLAACKAPVTKAVPYVIKPEEITPGVANFYASTYFDGNDYCPILIKTREGRPIFIKGNKESNITKGNVNARVNASVMSLYDSNRYKHPFVSGKKATWENVDSKLSLDIEQAKKNNKKIYLISRTIISPSLKQIIDAYKSYKGFEHVTYDDISYSAMLEANKEMFDVEALPTYHFDNAKTIVSIGADFLSGWIHSIANEVGYSKRRNPDGEWMSKCYQFEANYSISGSKADVRIPIKLSEYSKVLKSLYNEVAKMLGHTVYGQVKTPYASEIKEAAKELVLAKGQAILLYGNNDKPCQMIANQINYLLGAYNQTIDLNNFSYIKQDNGKGLQKLIEDANADQVDVLMMYGVDLVAVCPESYKAEAIVKKAKTSVSFSIKPDQTSVLSTVVCPDNHALESWSDYRINRYDYSLAQPVISKLFDTRQFGESLLTWSGNNIKMLDYIKGYWKEHLMPLSEESNPREFWNNSLHDGVLSFHSSIEKLEAKHFDLATVFNYKDIISGTGNLEVIFYQKEAIGNGIGADNPFLQELPDPISKVTWDNYIAMNPTDMREKGFNIHIAQKDPASLVSIDINGVKVDRLPVVAQPGQKKGTISIALGYGKKVGKMKEPVGKNVFPCMSISKDGHIGQFAKATIMPLGETYFMARTQTHHTVMGRGSVIKETDINTYKSGNKDLYNKAFTLPFHENGKTVQKPIKEIDLWGAHPVEQVGHRWGMSVDLNACTGCGACITACNIENNIPVVGKDEVRRGREMHWLRIDRYYSSDMTKEKAKKESVGAIEMYRKMEKPSDENPQVVHQPMMCQHCNHAGCETVCPVAATTHSNEGLNMMTYNRCIGTRYCANNCAYKVRRFNWFNYIGYSKFKEVNPSQDSLGRFVLNPDVVVRSRGVMEKCSLCVHKIQAAKLKAKKEGTPVMDGMMQTACAEACGSGAIVSGDLNDKNSLTHKLSKTDRAYRVIEEVGQQPNIYYQTKVHNV